MWGEDGDVGGIKGIGGGRESMRVYKGIRLLGNSGGEIGVELGNGEEGKGDRRVNNGVKDVGWGVVRGMDVNKKKMKDRVIKEGLEKEREV